MIIKIISGGQNGADLGAIEAAKEVGFPTGGCMPNGYYNHDGKHPEFAKLYEMTEHSSSKYPPRTFENAKNSDATLRFACDFETAGEKCTLKAINQYSKPYMDIALTANNKIMPTTALAQLKIEEVIKWIVDNKIKILNVAGNSNKTHPSMQSKVKNFMIEVLTRLKEIT